MSIRPSTPEIITVNSERLQAQIRDLLPSQNGFGSELQASNIIVPMIDLTRSAEGSILPYALQTAVSFGSQTAFNTGGTTDLIEQNTGFYRIFGTASVVQSNSQQSAAFTMTDGLATKTIWDLDVPISAGGFSTAVPFDFIVFIAAGQSISSVCTSFANLAGSSRQVATGDGTLVEPNGYPL